MKQKEILALKRQGLKNDSIYQIAAGNMNLFHVAFYGHKGTRKDKHRLQRTWKRILITTQKT